MIFSQRYVYSRNYTYDEMKVMCVLAKYPDIENLDYEDLMRICEAVYAHWVDGRDVSEDEKYQKYPWLEMQGREEGYIQVYAQRILPELIELYMAEELK